MIHSAKSTPAVSSCGAVEVRARKNRPKASEIASNAARQGGQRVDVYPTRKDLCPKTCMIRVEPAGTSPVGSGEKVIEPADRAMLVLIVEDEVNVARLLEMRLGRAGLKTFSTAFGEKAIELATIYDYDLIVLDLNLPDMHGSDVLCTLRNNSIATPVLVLTGDDSVYQKLRCLRLGADDFLPKPFHCDELIARIHAIVRRAQRHKDAMVRVGRLAVNLDMKSVLISDEILNLTPREYQVLEVLALRKGALVTRTTILNHLYAGMDEPEPNVINVYVCKIRKKLDEALGAGPHINVVWGRGYTLLDPASAAQTTVPSASDGGGGRARSPRSSATLDQ